MFFERTEESTRRRCTRISETSFLIIYLFGNGKSGEQKGISAISQYRIVCLGGEERRGARTARGNDSHLATRYPHLFVRFGSLGLAPVAHRRRSHVTASERRDREFPFRSPTVFYRFRRRPDAAAPSGRRKPRIKIRRNPPTPLASPPGCSTPSLYIFFLSVQSTSRICGFKFVCSFSSVKVSRAPPCNSTVSFNTSVPLLRICKENDEK